MVLTLGFFDDVTQPLYTFWTAAPDMFKVFIFLIGISFFFSVFSMLFNVVGICPKINFGINQGAANYSFNEIDVVSRQLLTSQVSPSCQACANGGNDICLSTYSDRDIYLTGSRVKSAFFKSGTSCNTIMYSDGITQSYNQLYDKCKVMNSDEQVDSYSLYAKTFNSTSFFGLFEIKIGLPTSSLIKQSDGQCILKSDAFLSGEKSVVYGKSNADFKAICNKQPGFNFFDYRLWWLLTAIWFLISLSFGYSNRNN